MRFWLGLRPRQAGVGFVEFLQELLVLALAALQLTVVHVRVVVTDVVE